MRRCYNCNKGGRWRVRYGMLGREIVNITCGSCLIRLLEVLGDEHIEARVTRAVA